jgi:CheY-like chemotaxis protein
MNPVTDRCDHTLYAAIDTLVLAEADLRHRVGDLARDEFQAVQRELRVQSKEIVDGRASGQPSNAEIIDDLVQLARLTIELSIDGIEALDQAQQCRYDLVLMDMQMPRMNRLEAARHGLICSCTTGGRGSGPRGISDAV